MTSSPSDYWPDLHTRRRAWANGFDAGYITLGANIKCPYPDDSPNADAWRNGFRNGTNTRADKLADQYEQTPSWELECDL